MVNIQIDGKIYVVKSGKNLLETCLALGLDIPHFCYHAALGSVGACRLCAVKKYKDKDDTHGKIIMSCMEPVTDGMIISIDDAEAKAFRAAVIESLMTNHPHDCPVCDEGGECHLQDMTVMTGHNYRRYDFNKRTYKDQNLGPFIHHEMNRCIQCYRCVRFYRDYAGGSDLNVFGSRNHVFFGRHEDGTLENEFSGNLVEVCPTGVFTDKTLRKHFTRKWDLSNAPSVCVHCSLGCNIIISERYGSLRRVMSRYNGAVNGYFICDRGRFGYEFVNDEKRIRKAQLRSNRNDEFEEVENEILFSKLSEAFSKNKKILGIGSPRASIESNFALSALVGKENFYHGISKKEQFLIKKVLDFLQNSGIQTPSLKQIEKADAVLILGEDITNTAPMVALAVRQAARNKSKEMAEEIGIPSWNDAPVRNLAQQTKSPVYILTPIKDSLDDISENTFRDLYSEIADLGFAVASAINDEVPVFKTGNKEQQKLAEKIALSLKNAKNPLIITGTNCYDEDILNASFNIARALQSSISDVMLSVILPECNSIGMALIPGKSIDDAIIYSENEEIETLVILENDLYRRAEEKSIDNLLGKSKQIIVQDHLNNKTSSHADIIIPSATFAEAEGIHVNNEGRAQRYYKAIANNDQIKESWRWIGEFINIKNNNHENNWKCFDDIVSSIVNELPIFSKLKEYMPDADFRMFNAKVPRQSQRYSGRTAMNAKKSVSETKISEDADSPLTFSMEGLQEQPPSSLVPFYWTPGWNSVQAMYDYLDEPNCSMKGGDPGIRLIEPNAEKSFSWFNKNSKGKELEEDEFFIVPVYKIFGSEELSSVGSAIAQRIQEPFVYLNKEDTEKLGVIENDIIQIEISDCKLMIKIKIENSLKQGLAGFSVNLPGMPFISIHGVAKLSKI